MNPLEVIHRQNAQAQLKGLQEKWVGQWVEAIPTSDPSTLVVGTVQDVMINNNRFEYQLAGRVGHYLSPEAVGTTDQATA